ncbi:actin interacting protein 3 [Spinellus fusiger]|nr:actin interacting protein 3 [Spinellus fusiger]
MLIDKSGNKEQSNTKSSQPFSHSQSCSVGLSFPPLTHVPPLPTPTNSSDPKYDTKLCVSEPWKNLSVFKQPTTTLTRKSSRSLPMNAPIKEIRTKMPLFLALGDHIKKVTYQDSLSFEGLKMLFLSTFNKIEEVSMIHIRDPDTMITYELEDLQDVKPNSLLSLYASTEDKNEGAKEKNTKEPEQQEPALTRTLSAIQSLESSLLLEIKSLQSFVHSATPKLSANDSSGDDSSISSSSSSSMSSNSNSNSSISMSSMSMSINNHNNHNNHSHHDSNDSNNSNNSNNCLMITDTHTPLNENRGKDSEMAVTNKIKSQQQEILSLRKDLAILRQVCNDHQKSTVDILTNLRQSTQQLRSNHKMLQPPRSYIAQTKQETKEAMSSLTKRLEDLQDTVDDIKLDVTQRKCRPSLTQLDHCTRQIKVLERDRETLTQCLKSNKPVWKKTWEEELRTIVQEQEFLKEQENLLIDIEEDEASMTNVLEQLREVSEIQRKHIHRRTFHVTPASPNTMISVLEQVVAVDVNHDRRLKALEHAEKVRARELANRIDAFEDELVTFVDSNKLKRTGGPEEIERQRQLKTAEMLKQLFTDGSRTPS